MCGLAGFVEVDNRMAAADLTAVVGQMSNVLRHRGPDDSGAWVDETAGIAMGFRRLAIIDLTDAGHQPQVSCDGRFVLVFNGEIYNHHDLRADLESAGHGVAWKGHSDTETLLQGIATWGVKRALERVNGMFAIAVWDRKERRLYLARDRFGEKPLFYGWTRGALVFGSELKALRAYPGFDNSVDRDVLSLYMQYACVPAPYSIFKHVYKVQPGCIVSLAVDVAARRPGSAPFAPMSESGIEIERFWCLESVATNGLNAPIRTEQEATDQLASLLSDAVRRQSMADVPLGAFLSGGIDSSTIVALMSLHNPGRVRTFTIGFAEAGFNEAEHAKAVARHLGSEHVELYVTPEQTRDVIPRLPALYCEPFADSSQIPTYLVSQLARQHVTVALSGDGGDELFGGYTRYLWGERVWSRLESVPKRARAPIASAIQKVPVSAWNAINRVSSRVLNLSNVAEKAQKLSYRLDHVNSLNDLYRELVTVWPTRSGVVPGANQLPTVVNNIGVDAVDPVSRMMIWDGLTYLPDDILHKVDRASMGVSLETRAPFLDHRVAELAWRLPLHMKIRSGTGKWIVRQLLYRHVPRNLIERPKAGFAIPIDSWLRGPLREWAEDLLQPSRLKSEGYLHAESIRQCWDEHLAGADRRHQLWSVLMFQSWLR